MTYQNVRYCRNGHKEKILSNVTTLSTERVRTGLGWTLPVAAATLALGLGEAAHLLSPLLIALVLGAVAANALRPATLSTWCSAGLAKNMLRVGIVLLGFRLSVTDLGALGWRGAIVVASTVLLTYSATLWLGRRMGVAEDLTQLIAAGFSICGAAAIAVVQDGVRATQRHVALALALVTLFGTAMIGLIPVGARALGLTAEQGGVWAGASIHEVAQVVAAGSLLGPAALATAVSIKLGRVLMLAPVHMLSVRTSGQGTNSVPIVPWFVVGFVAAVAARSLVAWPSATLSAIDTVATLLLAAGMFGLGAAIVLRDLFPLPWRSLALAAAATAVACLAPLSLVLLLW